MMKTFGVCLVWILAISSCAQLSPQKVALQTALVSMPPMTSESFELRVSDLRSEKRLGYRGGIYGTSSSVTVEPNVETYVQKQLAEALQRAGITLSSVMADRLMRVAIESFEYQSHKPKFWQRETVAEVELSLKVEVPGFVYSNRYRSRHSKMSFWYLNEEDNQQLINDVLESALNSLISDQDFQAFLSRHRSN